MLELMVKSVKDSGNAYFLLDLQRIHSRGKLAENLIGLLVELQLSGNQIS